MQKTHYKIIYMLIHTVHHESQASTLSTGSANLLECLNYLFIPPTPGTMVPVLQKPIPIHPCTALLLFPGLHCTILQTASLLLGSVPQDDIECRSGRLRCKSEIWNVDPDRQPKVCVCATRSREQVYPWVINLYPL